MTIISNHQQLLRFAGLVLAAHRSEDGPGDVDGGELQEMALACGLLEERTVDGPCGDNCHCDDFPAECYFLTQLGDQAMEAAAPEDDDSLPTLASFEGVAPNAVLMGAFGDPAAPQKAQP